MQDDIYKGEKMYTTRPLSLNKNSPDAISLPPEGPNSSYLVLDDNESTTPCCFGLCKYYHTTYKQLPFPQNRRFFITVGSGPHTSTYRFYLIPVINQPLSSNRYYAINANAIGKGKGKAYASSTDEDKEVMCCMTIITDVMPRLFNPEDLYHQFEFHVSNEDISVVTSVAPDGYPPIFLRDNELHHINGESIENITMRDPQGINASLRAQLPDFSFLSSQECSTSVVVGKWYCPFMFIKDGREKDQIENSVFYEMTLEQRWERIFAVERSYGQGKKVTLEVVVPIETVRIEGNHAVREEILDGRGMMYFKATDRLGKEKQVGLSKLIIERMIWEQNKVGWVDNKEKHVKVVRDEEYGGVGDWTSFGCYLLVESFVLKRNYGGTMLTFDFKHTHQIRSKWL